MLVYFKKIRNILIIFTLSKLIFAQDFSIARIHYDGGGDWYGDPSSIPNLLNYVQKNTSIAVNLDEARIKLTDSDLYSFSYLYLTGHGNIRFTEDEVGILREYLLDGGFLHADDNYGMDESFRREIKKVYPNKEFVELPHNHPVFSSYYKFEMAYQKST